MRREAATPTCACTTPLRATNSAASAISEHTSHNQSTPSPIHAPDHSRMHTAWSRTADSICQLPARRPIVSSASVHQASQREARVGCLLLPIHGWDCRVLPPAVHTLLHLRLPRRPSAARALRRVAGAWLLPWRMAAAQRVAAAAAATWQEHHALWLRDTSAGPATMHMPHTCTLARSHAHTQHACRLPGPPPVPHLLIRSGGRALCSVPSSPSAVAQVAEPPSRLDRKDGDMPTSVDDTEPSLAAATSTAVEPVALPPPPPPSVLPRPPWRDSSEIWRGVSGGSFVRSGRIISPLTTTYTWGVVGVRPRWWCWSRGARSSRGGSRGSRGSSSV